MQIGILSIMIFLPLLFALVLLIVPVGAKTTRNLAFLGTLVMLGLAIYVYMQFALNGSMQFSEYHPWIQNYGIHYSVGIDGFALIILMLIEILIPCAYLLLWEGRTKGYWVSMLLIQSGVSGALFSQDLILFYFFWESMLLPVFMIIGMFGSGKKAFSALKVTIYTMLGSLLMLVSILYLGAAFFHQFGNWSFELSDLAQISTLSHMEKVFLFFGFMIAFAIKIPLFPFHSWLLDTYSSSPTGGVFLLSSIMAKLGVYAVVRFLMPLFPDVYVQFAPYIFWVGLFGLFYFGIAAIMQQNIKKMFAYSSASHLGFITAGIFSLNVYGLMGAGYFIIAHAMATGALFLLVGHMEQKLGIRNIDDLGGIAKKAPVFTVFFMVMLLCSVGLPGTNGFVSEFLIVLGSFDYKPIAGVIAALTVIVAPSFMLWLFQRAILQNTDNDTSSMKDLNLKEVLSFLVISVLIFVMGFYPEMFLYKIEPTIHHYLRDILELGGL